MNKELARRGKPDFLIALAGFAICVLQIGRASCRERVYVSV